MSAYIRNLKAGLEATIRAKQAMLNDSKRLEDFSKAVEAVATAYRTGGRLYVAGNGGSAADAQHLATEFVVKLAKPRLPLPAEALTVDSSTLTAIGNDFGFEEIFARQVEGKMTRSDIFLGITTSGTSKNIIRALKKCRELGITSVVFSGRDGGQVKELADHCVIATGDDTSVIQEVHSVLCHSLCSCIEQLMFADISKEIEKRVSTVSDLRLDV